MRILVVEDEPKVAGALSEGLETEDCGVTVAGTGEDGFFRANATGFDLIILDVMCAARATKLPFLHSQQRTLSKTGY